MRQDGEAGLPVAELLRKYGVGHQTDYSWKARYCGATVSETRQLKELKLENWKLESMYADLGLENAAIKYVLGRRL